MALLAASRGSVLRGFVQSAGRLPTPTLAPVQHRGVASTQATAKDGAAAAKKKKAPVGKAILAERLAQQHGLSNKAAGEIIETLLDDIMLSVAEGEDVTIVGFGSFKKRTRAARKGRNPTTGAPLDIPEKDAPAFSAGSVFKGVVQAGSWEALDEVMNAKKAAKKNKA